ncbi:MAG: hypothetical protein AAFW01_04835 [Pseudomonadota bacterium]
MPMLEVLRDWLTRRALSALAIVITGAALVGSVAVLQGPRDPGLATVMSAQIANEEAAADWTADLKATADAFAARPLFHASRRPWQPEEQPAASAPAPTPAPILMGVVGVGNEYLALVVPRRGEPARSMRPGGRIGPWQILAVGPEHMEITNDRGEHVTVRLERAE